MLHRPSNVDERDTLAEILGALARVTRERPIVFPIHPRTRKRAAEVGWTGHFRRGGRAEGIWITEPLGYLQFLHLNMGARFVLTDSGGLQEETTVLVTDSGYAPAGSAGLGIVTVRHLLYWGLDAHDRWDSEDDGQSGGARRADRRPPTAGSCAG